MAKTRKDLRGRALRKGEMQRSSDKRYAYSYTGPLGRRKYRYAKDLVTLREKEAQLMKDQLDGLDIYVAGIRPQVLPRIDVNHPAAGRRRAKIFTLADTMVFPSGGIPGTAGDTDSIDCIVCVFQACTRI